MYKSQYGFRKQMSTSLAIIELVEEITNSIDNHEATVGVFIDLKKAFDTVDQSILIEKLYNYGICGTANKWICSYLMNRYQYVTINGSNSDYMNVLCGVPQGSILGPILFILYINDMCNVSTLLKPILFTDDTNLFYSGKDIDELCSVVSIELDKLCIWFQVNKLSLNTSKTNFINHFVFVEYCHLELHVKCAALYRTLIPQVVLEYAMWSFAREKIPYVTRSLDASDGWSLVRDRTNRKYCPSHKMWSYKRDGRW